MRGAVASLLLLSGCAYAFTFGGGGPDRSAANVYVMSLVDSTSDGRGGPLVTERLRSRLGMPEEHSARFVLEGEITAVETENIAVARADGPAAGLATLRVRGQARLADRAGKVVFETGSREGTAELVVGGTVSETEDMRRQAMERACTALGDSLADAVMAR